MFYPLGRNCSTLILLNVTTGCVTVGLNTGLCCPTGDGVYLDCCQLVSHQSHGASETKAGGPNDTSTVAAADVMPLPADSSSTWQQRRLQPDEGSLASEGPMLKEWRGLLYALQAGMLRCILSRNTCSPLRCWCSVWIHSH